jgi:hypothetical protein
VKRCVHCRHFKPRSAFYRAPAASDGLQSWCKACVADRVKRWQTDHPDRATYLGRRWRHRQRGLFAGDYARIAAEQNGRCAICGDVAELVIDHDHEDGRVRGLLCNPCNVALGLLADEPGRLRAAAAYLERGDDLRSVRPLFP